MRWFLGILIFIIFSVFILFFLYISNTLHYLSLFVPVINYEGSKVCTVDSDCKSKWGMDQGCWSKEPNYPLRTVEMTAIGPQDCICYINNCESANKVVGEVGGVEEKKTICNKLEDSSSEKFYCIRNIAITTGDVAHCDQLKIKWPLETYNHCVESFERSLKN